MVKVGHGADLLVHEATFEDGMEEEAVLKMHSTVSEALSIAKRMDTKACILTHFSQRYPRIPPLREEDSQLPFPVAFAFDFMKVNPENIGIIRAPIFITAKKPMTVSGTIGIYIPIRSPFITPNSFKALANLLTSLYNS